MQCCMAKKGSLKEFTTSGFSEGLRECFLFFDARHAQSELKRQDVKSFNSTIAATERLMDYRVAVTSSGKKEQGGNKHLDNKPVNKCKETKVVLDGDKGEEHKDKMKFLGCFLCQGPHLVKTIQGGRTCMQL
ncbi:unnamed protein product [Prunus armeniaca]